MKNKKYILGLFLGIAILVGGGSIASASSVVATDTTITATNTDDLDMLIIYNQAGDVNLTQSTPPSGTTLTYLTDLVLTPATNYKYVYTHEEYPAQYNACFSLYGGTYTGCLAQHATAIGGSFTTANAILTGGGGIGFFKSGGSYQASNMIGQTATALQSTMGLNGLAPMLAIVAGISIALMLGLWISNLFGEAKKGLKETEKKKQE